MNRIQKLREKGVSAALYTSEINMHYLSGYTGEGALLVLPDSATIITDFRYIEQAERQSPECKVERTGVGKGRNAIVKELLETAGVTELAIETGVMTVSEYRRTDARGKGRI